MNAKRSGSGRPRRRRVLWLAVLIVLCLAGCSDRDKPAAGTKPKGWKHALADIASEITLGAEGGYLFYAFDTLAYPGQSVDLVARVLVVKKASEVEGATVGFFLGETLLGQAETDDDGNARLAWKPPKPGDYEIAAKVLAVDDEEDADALACAPASLLVSARQKQTRFIIIDLDHTVVASGFARVLLGGARPMPGAAGVIDELRRDYSIIYLTHRPGLLAGKSKRWLADNGFCRAPLLVSTLAQVVRGSAKFKTGRLKALRREFPNVAIGIGDKFSDAEAYVANGLKAFLIPHYDEDDDEELLETAKAVRELSKDVQVVENWQQIRAGIATGETFAPAAFAARLQARARSLEAEDDEDDD